MKIQCGYCRGCRVDQRQSWTLRIVQEASLYDANQFVTLTYAPEHLPQFGSLLKEDYQKFLKRTRKKLGSGLRYFLCGEYGEALSRPHYHAIMFNFALPDMVEHWRRNVKTGKPQRFWTSDILNELWQKGLTELSEVTTASASYVAGYTMKKLAAPTDPLDKKDYYQGKLPEFTTMSRRPGIGKAWLDKFWKDIYSFDKVVLPGGFYARPPKYYDEKISLTYPLDMEKIKAERKKFAEEHPVEEARLKAMDKILEQKLENSRRNYEVAV